MDGVLIDSFDAWYSAFNDTLRNFGESPLGREEFRNNHWGSELLVNMKRLGLGEEEAEYCRSRYGKYISKVTVFPDTREVLKSIDEKLGVVTSTGADLTNKILNQFDLRKFFDVIITSNSVEKPKPAPNPVLEACDKLGIDPEEAVFVGDSNADMQAGRESGCKVIGLGVKGDLEIRELSELPKLLEQSFST